MKTPVFKLRAMQRLMNGQIHAELVQEVVGATCCSLASAPGVRTWKVIKSGPIEQVLEHAMANGFVVENVKIEPLPANAVAPVDRQEDQLDA